MLSYPGKLGKTKLKSLRKTLKAVMSANNACKTI